MRSLVSPAFLATITASPVWAADAVPKGLVAFMNTVGGQSCPDGWREAQYATGRLVPATPHDDKIGIPRGTALRDEEPPTHGHAYDGEASVGHAGTVSSGLDEKDEDVGKAGHSKTNGATARSEGQEKGPGYAASSTRAIP